MPNWISNAGVNRSAIIILLKALRIELLLNLIFVLQCFCVKVIETVFLRAPFKHLPSVYKNLRLINPKVAPFILLVVLLNACKQKDRWRLLYLVN
jgi:hypothetical protein